MPFQDTALYLTQPEIDANGVVGMPDIPALTTVDMQKRFDGLATYLGVDKYNALLTALNNPTSGVPTVAEMSAAIADAEFEAGSGDMQRLVYDQSSKQTDIYNYADTAVDGAAEALYFAINSIESTLNDAISDVQTTAEAAMPEAGGTFTGDVVAINTNRSNASLRNIEVRTTSDTGTLQSTNKLICVRK